jgi:hypothetical protein
MSARVSEAHHVGVIGAGTMGAGIATSCLAGGLRVTLVDSQSAALASGLRRIHEALDAAVNKGRLTPEARAAAEVAVANDIAALGAADVVIEAVFENLQLKQDVFRELDARSSVRRTSCGWLRSYGLRKPPPPASRVRSPSRRASARLASWSAMALASSATACSMPMAARIS